MAKRKQVRKPISEQTTAERAQECLNAMSRLRATFKQGDNRFGEYGRNVRDAFERQAKTYAELTGKPAPSIYD